MKIIKWEIYNFHEKCDFSAKRSKTLAISKENLDYFECLPKIKTQKLIVLHAGPQMLMSHKHLCEIFAENASERSKFQ